MRAALLEASEKPLDDRRRHRHRRSPRRRGARARVALRRVSLRPLARERHVPVRWRRRCSGTKRRASSTRSARVSRRLAPGDKVVLTPIAGVQRVLLVRARRVRLLRQRGVDQDGHAHATGARRSRARALPVLRGVGLGGFAEYVITPETGAIKVAADTPLDVACVIGCAVQTGVGAVLNTATCPRGRDRARARARAASASRSCRARASPARRRSSSPIRSPSGARTAKRFGATDVIDPTADDVLGAVQQLTAASVSTTRSTRSAPGRVIESCIWATRNGGTTVMVGAGGIDQTVTLAPPVHVHDDRTQAHGLPARRAATGAATSRACSRCGAPVGSTSRA